MTTFLTSILHLLNWIISIPSMMPADGWALLGSALGVSVVMQALKHWIDDEVDPRIIVTLTTILSGIGASLVFVISQLSQNPTVLGSDTATILGIATLLYRFFISKAYGFLLNVKAYQQNKSAAPATQQPETTAPVAPAVDVTAKFPDPPAVPQIEQAPAAVPGSSFEETPQPVAAPASNVASF